MLLFEIEGQKRLKMTFLTDFLYFFNKIIIFIFWIKKNYIKKDQFYLSNLLEFKNQINVLLWSKK
jgi:hypothetical protein